MFTGNTHTQRHTHSLGKKGKVKDDYQLKSKNDRDSWYRPALNTGPNHPGFLGDPLRTLEL